MEILTGYCLATQRRWRHYLEESMSKPINLTNDIIPRIVPFFHQTIQNKGKNCFVWFGPTPAVIFGDPELVKEVLTRHTIYQKPQGSPLSRLLTLGIGSLEEAKWAKHRKILNPAFHVEKLKLMTTAFHTSCIEMLSDWEEIVLKTNGSGEVDVWPDLEKMMSDVISRTAFGSNYEEGRKIFELQAEQSKHFEQVLQELYLPGWR
ncbi:OLC1v1013579C1 [Oldenlandia corymbosa var. corymbosa]|uniref:OLC1v1013579C1 n=1 Tax=Oldenlandia corymbosa var. corymbosa TaxID=529605 RepID=A0AAV1DZ19_OLDCO|nr:OLC1v1013579C1 [Oldenlandia corymbosa var. corymbosa]